MSALDFKYLRTGRINTDCIENFFGSVRQQGGNNVNPTPIQFQRCFRKLFCLNYLHTENMNCKNDFDEILLNFKSTSKSESVLDLLQETGVKPKAISIIDHSYRSENIPTQNAFTYVCGYLIKRALERHDQCEVCQKFGRECQELDSSRLLTKYKAFDATASVFGSHQSPPEDFVKFVYRLELIFRDKFKEMYTGDGISHKLLNAMEQIEFNYPCIDFPKTFILKLFIRMKIFYTMKYTNRELSLNKRDKNVRKLRILSHI